MLGAGFTDNGGAIHSAERILNILGPCLCYPQLSHINNLRDLPNAPFSEEALKAYKQGKRVLIEHVSPHRELTRLAISKIDAGATDAEFIDFVCEHYQLALLTEEETARLNKINRSRIDPSRLMSAGIRLVSWTSSSSAPRSAA
jgi:hypothetical protein